MSVIPKSIQALLAPVLLVSLLPIFLPGPTAAQTPNKLPADQQRPKHLVQPVLKQQKLDPQMEQILANWEKKTAQIRMLEGEHQRQVFDTVFFVAKKSKGQFYYEAPDKGRIDLESVPVKPGTTVKKHHPDPTKKGEVVQFNVQADSPEMWISDGEFITQVDLANKTGSRYPIPPPMRGTNVIDGPLPFLFGLKAEKAKLRYTFQLVQINEQGIFLHIEPKLRQDAANYSSAEVLLDPVTYLPRAVQLVDPAKTKITLFLFPKLEVNKKGNVFDKIFNRNPFKPRLPGYKIVTYGKVVPSVVGLSWKSAVEVLARTGFNVTAENIKTGKGDAVIKPGKPATRSQLKWVVYDQQPPAKSPLIEGNQIVLTLYIDANQASRKK